MNGQDGHRARQVHHLVHILLVLLCCLPAQAAGRLIIPFDVNSYGQMVVHLRINDTAPAIGIVDTAATHAMIDLATANAAGVSMPGDAMINVLGLEGAEIFPLVSVDSVTAGNVRLGRLDAALNRRIEILGVHNVLPASAFAGDVIDFDFEAGRICVYNGRPDTSTTLTSTRLPMRQIKGLWFAEVRLNGKMGLALIDTGSSISYVNSRFADDAGAKPNEEKTRKLHGITGAGVAIRVATARRFSLGRHRVKGPDLIVADPAIFSHLGLADEPVMVLGLDYLSIFRVQLDRRESRLVLSSQGSKRGMSGVEMNAGGARLWTNQTLRLPACPAMPPRERTDIRQIQKMKKPLLRQEKGLSPDSSVPQGSQHEPVTPGFTRTRIGRTAALAHMVVQAAGNRPGGLADAHTGQFKQGDEAAQRFIGHVRVLVAFCLGKAPSGRVLPQGDSAHLTAISNSEDGHASGGKATREVPQAVAQLQRHAGKCLTVTHWQEHIGQARRRQDLPELHRLERLGGHVEQGQRIAGPAPSLRDHRRLARAMNKQGEPESFSQVLDRKGRGWQQPNDPCLTQRRRKRSNQREPVGGDDLHVPQHAACILLGEQAEETVIVTRLPQHFAHPPERLHQASRHLLAHKEASQVAVPAPLDSVDDLQAAPASPACKQNRRRMTARRWQDQEPAMRGGPHLGDHAGMRPGQEGEQRRVNRCASFRSPIHLGHGHAHDPPPFKSQPR